MAFAVPTSALPARSTLERSPRRRFAPCSVVPLHSHKLIATLQHALARGDPAASGQRNPLLIRVEVRAGPLQRGLGRGRRACGGRALPSRCHGRGHVTGHGAAAAQPVTQSLSWVPNQVKAGHGAGKPTAKIIQETADLMAFAAKCMGATWHGGGK